MIILVEDRKKKKEREGDGERKRNKFLDEKINFRSKS